MGKRPAAQAQEAMWACMVWQFWDSRCGTESGRSWAPGGHVPLSFWEYVWSEEAEQGIFKAQDTSFPVPRELLPVTVGFLI